MKPTFISLFGNDLCLCKVTLCAIKLQVLLQLEWIFRAPGVVVAVLDPTTKKGGEHFAIC